MSDVNATQTGTWNVAVTSGLATGANVIGNVSVTTITLPGLTTGANNIGIVNVAGGVIVQNAAYLTTNPLVTGGVYYATQPTINANSATWMSMTTRAGLIVATGVDTFNVTVSAGLPVSANAIGLVNTNADAAIGAGTAPAKALVAGAVFNTSLPSLTNGQTAALQVDAGGRLITNGAVTIGGLSPSSNTIGFVQAAGAQVEVIPTVTAATYAANKVIGGIMTFANILPATPFMGLLTSIELKFKASLQTVEFNVGIFTTSPGGTFTDTNTAAIAAADSTLLLGVYRLIASRSTLGTHTIYNLDGIYQRITGASASLFVVVVPLATTAALASTTDMQVRLGCVW